MFRASSCPSSGATTAAVAASGLPSELGDSSAVGRGLCLLNSDWMGLQARSPSPPLPLACATETSTSADIPQLSSGENLR
jgi:hypothetical protein